MTTPRSRSSSSASRCGRPTKSVSRSIASHRRLGAHRDVEGDEVVRRVGVQRAAEPLGRLVDVAVVRVLLAALEDEVLEEVRHPVLLGALRAGAGVERDEDRDGARAVEADAVQRQAVGQRGGGDRGHGRNGSTSRATEDDGRCARRCHWFSAHGVARVEQARPCRRRQAERPRRDGAAGPQRSARRNTFALGPAEIARPRARNAGGRSVSSIERPRAAAVDALT